MHDFIRSCGWTRTARRHEGASGVNAVEVRNLSRSFDGRDILSDVSFTVGHGEIFGYLGPNGAGKTTTIRILLGLLAPGAGDVRVLGRDLAADDDARARVGVLFENNAGFSAGTLPPTTMHGRGWGCSSRTTAFPTG